LGVLIILSRQIDHYTISEKLGRGKYAHLFSGHEKKHRKKVAIKVLLPIKPEKIKR
jgi:serine/threonine protein kinase